MKSYEFLDAVGDIRPEYVRMADTERSVRKKTFITKLVPVAACFALLLVAAGIIGGKMGLFGTAGKEYKAELTSGDTVVYSNSTMTATSFAPGYPVISRELTADELSAVFPQTELPESAVGTFRDETGELVRVEGKVGEATVIYACDDVPVSDAVIEGNESLSYVSGIPVSAGYFITKANSRGEQSAIFFATYKIGETNAYVECSGPKAKADDVSRATAELLQNLINGGEPNFEGVRK